MSRWVLRLYALLLYCYPPSLRRQHGREMRQFLRASLAERPAHEVSARLVADAARSLPREWLRAIRIRRPPPSAAYARPGAGEPVRNLLRDVRYAGRLFRKNPGFSAAAIVTLALGIGANTAIFSLADATVLRPLQVANPSELVAFSWSSSYPDFEQYAARGDVFSGVAAAAGSSRLVVTIDASPELARAAFVSGSLFTVLGVPAALGRTLQPLDERSPIAAVISYDFWRSRFGSDPAIIGRIIHASGRPITIVGVAARTFHGTNLHANPDFYMTLQYLPVLRKGFFVRPDMLTRRDMVWLEVIGRLRDGVSADQATSAMDALYRQFHPPRPGATPERLRLVPLATNALGKENAPNVRRFTGLLLGVVGLTLLIGCANLANLLLAKGTARRREIGVRLAVGASRGRVVRQMLVESLLLAFAGGTAGVFVAAISLDLLSAFQLPGGIEISDLGLHINTAALAATVVLSLATGLLFGVAPALSAARTDLLASFDASARGASARSGLRAGLVAAQVALSLVLLAGSGLFLRGLVRALEVPLGFNTEGVVSATVSLGQANYGDARSRAYFDDAIGRVRRLPNVTSVAWTKIIPIAGSMVTSIGADGYVPAPGEEMYAHTTYVGADYFNAAGTRLLQGRPFSDQDDAGSVPVAIVNETMARKYWQGRSPLGGRVKAGDDIWLEVVGVAEDTKVDRLDEPPFPFVYLAFRQHTKAIASDPVHLLVRTSGDVRPLLPLVREQLLGSDPRVPVYDVLPLDDRIRELVMPQRMGLTLFGVFSLLALILAAIGIYAVSSFVAALRMREIGIRMALGANGREIRRFVLRQGITPVALGLAAGVPFAVLTGHAAARFLYGVSPADPLTLGAVAALLASVSAAAVYVPARRASRTDPIAALRHD